MDTLGNVLTKIRNASAVGQAETTAPLAKLTKAVLEVLVREGFLSEVTEELAEPGQRGQLRIGLKYVDRLPAILRVRRLSKPGRRVYAGAHQLPRPKGGYGTLILSTSAGIITAREAKKRNLGGELLCEVIRGEGQ